MQIVKAVGDGGITVTVSHTHTNLLFHIVFSTQGYLPLVAPELKSELFAYLGGLLKELKAKPIIINGMCDHVHILVLLRPDIHLSEAMRFLKANSSRWFRQRSGKKFAWQKGFGAFSVSRSNADAVARYIKDQERHHSSSDFRSEYIELLNRHEVEYDERDI